MKRSFFLFGFVILSVLFLSVSLASATFYSNFDSNDEGWVVYYGVVNDGVPETQSPQYCDGHICTDIDRGLFWKDGWTDWSDLYGGTIEFDLKIVGEGEYNNLPPIILETPGPLGSFARSVDFTINSELGIWNHYEIELLNKNFFVTEEAGGGTLQDILSDITGLFIRGDYLSGSEFTCIDNVRVRPVPEPTTMLLLGFGLFGLVGFRKKFKQR
jgi:hypothetical protein